MNRWRKKKDKKPKSKLPSDLADVLKRQKREDDATQHRPSWRDEAVAAGWPDFELDTLSEIIANAATNRSDERVVAVSRRSIFLYTVAEFSFGDKTVIKRTRWKWRFHPKPEIQIVARSEHDDRPWCPGHGTTCLPREPNSCGAVGVITYELCGCVGRYHDQQCEISLRSKEGELREKLKAAIKPEVKAFDDAINQPELLPEQTTLDEPDHQPGSRPTEKRKKPSKSNNWYLPGQLALPISPQKR